MHSRIDFVSFIFTSSYSTLMTLTLFANAKTLLKNNWKSGLTVALVSLPMSISIGVASGSTPTAAIITAIWAGLIASLFGSSNYNITGPAGALTGILAAAAFTFGAGVMPVLAIIVGIVIGLAYLLRLNKYLVFIPSSVIHGFTLGVGMMLILSQINFAFGLQNLAKHAEFLENVITSISSLGMIHIPTFIVFLLFLTGLFVLLRLLPKVPAVPLLTPVAICIGYLSVHSQLPFSLQTLGQKFPTMSASLIQLPHFVWSYSLVSTAITIAIIAMLETLLCGKVAAGMTKTKFDERRELLGLSLANIVSGLFGGLPATAVLARTALNAKSGATHRASQGINAVIIAIVSLVFLATFKFLPLAVVAAILVFTAIRMIEAKHLYRYMRYEQSSFWIAFGVALLMIFSDPLIAIISGSVASLFILVERLSRGTYSLRMQSGLTVSEHNEERNTIQDTIDSYPDDVIVYTIKGALVYMSVAAHIEVITKIKLAKQHIIIRLGEITFMDSDGADALDEIINTLESYGASVSLTRIPQRCNAAVLLSDRYNEYLEKGKVFETSNDALCMSV
jgi:sulfate permease, SulP family